VKKILIYLTLIGGIIMAGIFAIIPLALINWGEKASDVGNRSYGNNYDCSGVVKIPPDQYQWVKDAAQKHLNGDEAALIALIQKESSWNPKAVNPEGPVAGLGQFTPGTARGFPEFVGGDDKHGIVWPKGVIYDDPTPPPDDARFDPRRSIYGAAHLFSGCIKKYGGFREGYEKCYYGGGEEGRKYSKILVEIYNKLINGGGCKKPEQNLATITGEKGCNNVPFLKQCDPRWAKEDYGYGTTVCDAGCGVTAAAMVLNFYGKNVTPADLAQIALNKNYREKGGGTRHGFFAFIAKENGLQTEKDPSWDKAISSLKKGIPVIVSGNGPEPFTSKGHFIVLTCYNEKDHTISVNDPARNMAVYPESLIKNYQYFISIIYP
jgi:hypothetical protein